MTFMVRQVRNGVDGYGGDWRGTAGQVWTVEERHGEARLGIVRQVWMGGSWIGGEWYGKVRSGKTKS